MTETLEKPLLLLVDDVATNLHILVEMLRAEYRIKTATNGLAALDIAARDDKPTLILLDVMMPGISGIETLRLLRENPKTVDIPVIFISADASEQSQLDGLVLGADEYLTKPFISSILRLRVKNLLQRKRIEAQLAKAKDAAESAMQSVASLLNHSGQGFLTFGANLIVDAQYSLACETMLGASPAGKDFSEIFFFDDYTKADLFCTVISSVVAEEDSAIRESMLSLLPTEVQRESAILKIEYKLLENGNFMAILTDITEERDLQVMLDSERRRLELIVMAVSDSRSFFDTIEAFRVFCTQDLPRMLNSSTEPRKLLKMLYREIHTYKGLLNQFSFPNTPNLLHTLESELSGLALFGERLTRQQLLETVMPETLLTPFEDDLAILAYALGEQFLSHGDSFVLSRTQVSQLENLATHLLAGGGVDVAAHEVRCFLNELVNLRNVLLSDALKSFNGFVRRTAERIKKKVVPLEVTCTQEVWIDPRIYQPFLHSLAHVFRNALIHGIETPEARWEMDKDEAGKISCNIVIDEHIIYLSIRDDGAGIRLDELRQRAVTAGIYTADEVRNVANDQLVQLVFRDEISTHHEVNELAGRGVGLAAVFDATKSLGGDVMVKTRAGQGTEFVFTLPLHQPTLSDMV